MREQRPAAGRLIAQGVAERLRLDRDEDEIGLPGEMPGGGLGGLRGGREMDEAVGAIDRRAGEGAGVLGRAPEIFRTDFEDQRHEGSDAAAAED